MEQKDENKHDVEERFKPKRPLLPKPLVARQKIENSPIRRRKIVRSKAKTSTNHKKLEHGIRQKHSVILM